MVICGWPGSRIENPAQALLQFIDSPLLSMLYYCQVAVPVTIMATELGIAHLLFISVYFSY
jgi:hypothetical protein